MMGRLDISVGEALTLDFGSGHDPTVLRFSPMLGSALGMSLLKIYSLSSAPSSARMCVHAHKQHSFSLSQKKEEICFST